MKIMDTIAYDGPKLVLTSEHMESLTRYEVEVLNKAVDKYIKAGKIVVEYDYRTDIMIIRPKI